MDSQSLQIQALIAFIMPLLIQWAKRSQAPVFAWIDQNKPKICVLTSAGAALLTSTGIEIARAPGVLTIHYPDATTILRGLLAFAAVTIGQIAVQHSVYGGFWKRVSPSPPNPPGVAGTGDKGGADPRPLIPLTVGG